MMRENLAKVAEHLLYKSRLGSSWDDRRVGIPYALDEHLEALE